MALAEILARPLIVTLKELQWPIDLVTPVPAGRIHQEERGYNQAALLARPVALGCGIPYRPRALVKIKEARSQVGLTFAERYQNVSGVFLARPAIVQGKNVLVIDDVTTSGATLEACAKAILTARATKVYGLTLARTQR